jgi:hypothetical protein
MYLFFKKVAMNGAVQKSPGDSLSLGGAKISGYSVRFMLLVTRLTPIIFRWHITPGFKYKRYTD